MVELLLSVAAIAAGTIAIGYFESLWEREELISQLPLALKAPMSDYDQEMMVRTRELIQECLCENGNSLADSMRNMSYEERLQSVRDFSARLAELNGLNLEISFFSDKNIANCGGYSYDTNTASFNIVELAWPSNDRNFDVHIRNFIDTIIHEQRHAVQIRAIKERGFWQIDDERRAAWANNLPPRYISHSVDARAYRMQPLESDAFTYAELVMEGVK